MDANKTLQTLHDTIGAVEKEIFETNTVIDWRRDNSWNTLEELMGLTATSNTVSLIEALQQHAVLACVDVISRDISKSKLDLYERLPNGGKRKVLPNEHHLARFLAMYPNTEHNWQEFWQLSTLHLVMASNVFMAKREERGMVKELIPVIPARVTIQHNPSTYEKFYEVTRKNLFDTAMLRGFSDYFTEDTMIHVRKRVVDGLHGFATLAAGGPTINLAKQIQDYQTRLYENDGQARIAVQQDAGMKPLADDAFRRLKQEIRAAAKNMMKNGEAMLLEPGYKAEILAMTAADMRVAETHEQMIGAVARVFGVPPHKIGHLSDEKYSNMEVLDRAYAQDVLVPIAQCFEHALARSLMSDREHERYFFEFDRRAMEIVDFKVRAEALKIGLQNGAITPDEFREVFGLNPLENEAGNVRFFQSTMTVVDSNNEVLIPAGGMQDTEPQEEPEPEPSDDDKQLRVVHSR